MVRSPWFFWTLSGSPFFSFQVSLNAIRCLKIFEAIIYLCRRNSSFFYELGWRPWTSTSNNQVQTTLLSSSQILSQITGMLRSFRDCEDSKCILLEVSKSGKDHPEIILTATRCSSFSSSSLDIAFKYVQTSNMWLSILRHSSKFAFESILSLCVLTDWCKTRNLQICHEWARFQRFCRAYDDIK